MVSLLFWLFILFLALSFYGISIENIINSPAGQQNLAYIAHVLSVSWDWFIAKLLTLQNLSGK